MNYEKIFPKVLEKTYPYSYKDISLDNLPLVDISSRVFGNKIISLPFLDIVNLKKVSKKDIKKLISKAINKKIEIKISESNLKIKQLEKIFLELGFNKNIVKGHLVSKLTSEDDFWKKFHKHTRNDIRKAEKSGLKLWEINSLEELTKFYDLYFKQMKKFGAPAHPFSFFMNCFELMGENFFGLNCYKDRKIIGSIILFIEDDYAYTSFNISDNHFQNFRPNDLLYWEIIKWCMKNKIRFLDIGQIALKIKEGSRQESLLKFKKKWLGEIYEKYYFTYNFKYDQKEKDLLKKFRKIWSKLPNFILKILGPLVNSQIMN